MPDPIEPVDIFVIGGGINGCGIARDAAGRGLRVTLAEMNDLASATSSASTKLFHGGLRYLEYFEFRLVREALRERETLLRAMPHISWPMRFVLPYHKDMRFEGDTPTSKLLTLVMPWMKGRRPAWLIRLGLFLYDTMGGRTILPGTKTVDLTSDPAGKPLKAHLTQAYEYSDCWVQDSRLVVLNARDAADRGATILTRSKVIAATPEAGGWRIEVRDAGGKTHTHRAKLLVNAGGPWVKEIISGAMDQDVPDDVRLVRGSHIVTKKLFDHDKCYFFQGEDGRIIFAIPYEGDFTLIGTTDSEHKDADEKPVCTEAEADYLRAFASQYFERPVAKEDIVWSYSGVRPLYNDGAKSATAATREYVLRLLEHDGAPALHVFGGKITTYRRLAEAAMEKIGEALPGISGAWTAGVALPGGDFPVDGFADLCAKVQAAHPYLSEATVMRLVRAYGTDALEMFEGAKEPADLGQEFAEGVFAREVDWTIQKEWVRTAEDYLWRRTKRGLRIDEAGVKALETYIKAQVKALI